MYPKKGARFEDRGRRRWGFLRNNMKGEKFANRLRGVGPAERNKNLVDQYYSKVGESIVRQSCNYVVILAQIDESMTKEIDRD